SDGGHKRSPVTVANLYLGLKYFMLYAVSVHAISPEQADEYLSIGWTVLNDVAKAQGEYQMASNPILTYVGNIKAALACGIAHIAAPDGSAPANNPSAYGWRQNGTDWISWHALGTRIGWIDGDNLYLEPKAAFAAAQN